MVMVGLLLIALVCLALGLVLPSSAWLIASLIASGGAGYLLVRARSAIGAARPRGAIGAARPRGAIGRAAAAKPTQAGRRARGSAAAAQLQQSEAAVQVDEPATTQISSPSPDDEVWVIDGRPRYHLADCAIIQGQDAEPIPYEQATEDGFMACSLCEPNVVRAAR